MTGAPQVAITLEDDPGPLAEEIEARLVESLRGNTPPNDHAPLALTAREDGRLIGGLAGGTSYGWLLVKVLWVAEDRRGLGLGSRLMREAEKAARNRGCHGVWLDTSSARAKAFYDRLGYEPFGTLENRPGEHPQGHARFFLCKRLAAEAQGAPRTGTEGP